MKSQPVHIIQDELYFGISAGEARANGVEVSEDVPDVAVLVPSEIDDAEISSRDGDDGQIIIDVKMGARWSWVNCSFEVTI